MWPLLNKLHDKRRKILEPLNLWSFQFKKPKKPRLFYNPSWQPCWSHGTQPDIERKTHTEREYNTTLTVVLAARPWHQLATEWPLYTRIILSDSPPGPIPPRYTLHIHNLSDHRQRLITFADVRLALWRLGSFLVMPELSESLRNANKHTVTARRDRDRYAPSHRSSRAGLTIRGRGIPT